MRSEKTPRARRYGLALMFILLGALTGAWHNRAVDHGRQDVLVGAVRGVMTPPTSALSKVSHWVSDQTGWIFRGRALAEENRSMKARLAELEGENTRLREADINYQRLRQDLGFLRNTPIPPLAADVIARRPDRKFDTLVIARGSRDGVQVNSAVMTRNGLVGRVFEVTPTTASVLMLTDQNSGVGGRVQRPESRATGVCKGDNTKGNVSRSLSMVYLAKDADIKPGDGIVTSGLGGVFPKGLPIGTVQEVKTDVGNALKVASVLPYVDFDRLEEVYVLR